MWLVKPTSLNILCSIGSSEAEKEKCTENLGAIGPCNEIKFSENSQILSQKFLTEPPDTTDNTNTDFQSQEIALKSLEDRALKRVMNEKKYCNLEKSVSLSSSSRSPENDECEKHDDSLLLVNPNKESGASVSENLQEAQSKK